MSQHFGKPMKLNHWRECPRRPLPYSANANILITHQNSIIQSDSEHQKLLHAATETQDKVEGRLLLDVVVREGAAVLELLAGEDETLLIGGDALLVLDLGLDVVNGVRGLDIEGDGLAGQGLDEDLHG